MNPPYRISEKAIEDLENIWLYTFKTWSKDQADKYYHLIINKIEFIAQNPGIGQPVDFIKPGYRRFPVKSHLIFYKRNKDKMVEIVRILHQTMDVTTRLKSE